jgi:hypothetical protein
MKSTGYGEFFSLGITCFLLFLKELSAIMIERDTADKWTPLTFDLVGKPGQVSTDIA